jgi:fructokinase
MLCVGTLGLVFDPSAGALEDLVAAAGDGVLVAVDPNCRPAAIPDPDAYRARLDRILARADLVKASDADLAWLQPGLAPAEAMRALIDRSRSAACAGVVTLGADGALIVPAGAGRPIAVAAPRVDVVDTIGAGDAFLGGLLAWWQRAGNDRAGLADAEALTGAVRYAVAVAARTCARAGADPPYADDPRLTDPR